MNESVKQYHFLGGGLCPLQNEQTNQSINQLTTRLNQLTDQHTPEQVGMETSSPVKNSE